MAKRQLESISLAVKYRPKVLADLVGQDPVAVQVRGMLKKGRVPSTMCLAGTSGGGKTTTARMIARYIQCSNPSKEDQSPCGECSNCRFEANHPDIHELNMADSRGIDDVRSIIQTARSMPQLGNKRIFILDEFQDCTPQAFKTLLKPLEEPPEHTLWIIATMQPEKVPPSIMGRCHKFYIKPIEEEVIIKRLKRIAKKEGIDFSEMKDGAEVLREITHLSAGRMRDAITMLENVLYALESGEKFTKKQMIAQFSRNPEVNLDDASAQFVASVFRGGRDDIKAAIGKIHEVGDCRGLLYKSRFLLQALTQSAVNQKFWRTRSWQTFMDLYNKEKFKVTLENMLLLQDQLCTLEREFNSISTDETILMSSRIGAYMIAMLEKRAAKKANKED